MITLLNHLTIHQAFPFNDAHIHERLILFDIYRFCHVQLPYRIVIAGNQFIHHILRQIIHIFHTVFCRRRRNRNYINTLLHMKLAGLAIGQSVIIINTIGNITVLLGFQNHQSTFDRVDCSGIDLNKVSLLNRNLTNQFSPLALFNHVL